jgi:membrane-associated phospholipid phosphatase
MSRAADVVAGDPAADRTDPATRRPSIWSQLTIIAVGLWLYDRINNFSPLRQNLALDHGVDLVHLERRLHLDPELAINHWLARNVSLAKLVGDYYDLAHFGVTLALLAWVFWRRPRHYRLLRNALLGINAIGFVVFWLYPVAPPRMLTTFGFIDIVAVTHAVGAWSSGALASQANEFAAMPSLHVAWALWCAIAVWTATRNRPARAIAVLYAIMTGVVVIATGNHYFLDVVAGAAAGAASAVGAWIWEQRRRGTPAQPADQPPVAG